MTTRKASTYSGIFITVLILSIYMRNSSLAILDLPLLTIIFISTLLQPKGLPALSVDREVNPSILTSTGQVKIQLTITNLAAKRLRALEIEDRIPTDAKVVAGSNRAVRDLDGNSRLTIEYYLQPASRGLYAVGPVVARQSDPLRLFPSEAVIGSRDPIRVYPDTQSVRMRIRPRRTGGWWGSTSSRRTGAGMEFFGVRAYSPGDDLRSINWKVTARSSKLMTNEYEAERASDAVILVDAGRMSGLRIDEKKTLDYEVEAGISVASFLLNAGNRVGLILHGKYRQWLYPGFGRLHYTKLREQLMLAREGDSEIPLSFLVSQLAPMILKPQSQIIVIAHPFSTDLPEAVISLKSLEYQVAAILILPYSSKAAPMTYPSLAPRILMLEKDETIAETQRLVPTALWRVNEPLSHVLRRLEFWVTRPNYAQ